MQGTGLLRGERFRAMGAGQLWGCRGKGEGHVQYHLCHAAVNALDLLAARKAYQ